VGPGAWPDPCGAEAASGVSEECGADSAGFCPESCTEESSGFVSVPAAGAAVAGEETAASGAVPEAVAAGAVSGAAGDVGTVAWPSGAGGCVVGAGVGVAVADGAAVLDGTGLRVIALGEAEAVVAGFGTEAPALPPERSNRSFRTPLAPEAAPAACSGRAGGVLPSAAWDADTPADRTSTAPTAAAEAPRRSPPWILVRERESSDLFLTIVIDHSDISGRIENRELARAKLMIQPIWG
jgi:hypothetical protein